MKKILLSLALILLGTLPLAAQPYPTTAPHIFGPVHEPGPLHETSSGDYADASSRASHWLNLIDNKQYSGAWLDAGSLLKDIVSQRQWTAGMQATRGLYGYVVSRTTQDRRTLTSLPHGTRGNFILIEYDTVFSRLTTVREAVVLMANEYGVWQGISYAITAPTSQTTTRY